MKELEISVGEAINHTNNLRNKLIISLIYHCAATKKDIIHLSFCDFNIISKRVRIGKLDYDIPGFVITTLCEYVSRTGNTKGLLFRNRYGNVMDEKNVYLVVSSVFESAFRDKLSLNFTSVLKLYKRSNLSEKEFETSLRPLMTPIKLRKIKIKEWAKSMPRKEWLVLAQYSRNATVKF